MGFWKRAMTRTPTVVEELLAEARELPRDSIERGNVLAEAQLLVMMGSAKDTRNIYWNTAVDTYFK